ncbi:hypothetical protein JB92DRAFT_1317178 [Gautieria morchelliformis]|nr:hypothetical protein JB92DRAFT_1317178 [Gautieria morchelliformis]
MSHVPSTFLSPSPAVSPPSALPHWCTPPYDPLSSLLVRRTPSFLVSLTSRLGISLSCTDCRVKANLVGLIISSFRDDCIFFDAASLTSLKQCCVLYRSASVLSSSVCDTSCRFRLVLGYVLAKYGDEFLSMLSSLPFPVQSLPVMWELSCMAIDPAVQVSNVATLPLPALTRLCADLGVPVKSMSATRTTCTSLLVSHFRACCTKLKLLDTEDIRADLHMSTPHAPVPDTRHDTLVQLLTSVYSSKVVSEMNRPVHLHHKARSKLLRREQSLRNLNDAARRSAADRADWPNVVPNDTILSCCRDYYNATMWTPPPMCASCARRRPSIPLIELVTVRGLPPPCNLELL